MSFRFLPLHLFFPFAQSADSGFAAERFKPRRLLCVQFYICSRRSLFDLLDSENEYFQAKMSYANAQYNLKNMKAEYLAATGTLLSHFSIEVPAIPSLSEAKIDMDKVVAELAKRQNDEAR